LRLVRVACRAGLFWDAGSGVGVWGVGFFGWLFGGAGGGFCGGRIRVGGSVMLLRCFGLGFLGGCRGFGVCLVGVVFVGWR